MGKWTENPEPVPPGEGEPLGEPETGGTYTHVHAALRHGGFCSGSNKNCRAAETRGLGRHPLVELADAWAWCHRRGGDGRKAVPPRPLLEVGRDRPTVPGESPERGGEKGAKERETVTLLELERTFKRGWLSRSVDGCRRVALSCCKGLTG